jgi:hypothetical protein
VIWGWSKKYSVGLWGSTFTFRGRRRKDSTRKKTKKEEKKKERVYIQFEKECAQCLLCEEFTRNFHLRTGSGQCPLQRGTNGIFAPNPGGIFNTASAPDLALIHSLLL